MTRRTGQRAAVLAGLLLLAAGAATAGEGTAPDKSPARDAAVKRRPTPFNFFIRDPGVRVLSDLTRAEVTFTTREPTHGRVEISTAPPADFPDVVPAGRPPGPSFPSDAVTMSWNNALGPKATRHDFRTFGLTPRTSYYCVLSASNAAGQTFRCAHQFTTSPQFAASDEVAPAGKERRGTLLDALRDAAGRLTGKPVSQAELSALAVRGAALAGEDPLAAELRKEQADRGRRRGADIGLAAAEGHTLPGPGKEAIRASLAAEERPGFDAAVSFSLDRNRNADLARRGLVISEADPSVAAARGADSAVLYRLGFDIATGFFGDPALGALGRTATGPGSLKVRDALSPAGRKGFDAAVAFHLTRTYKR